MDSRRSHSGHTDPLLLAVRQTGREVVTKKVVHVGIASTQWHPLLNSISRIHPPQIRSESISRALCPKDNLLEERSEKNQSDLSLH